MKGCLIAMYLQQQQEMGFMFHLLPLKCFKCDLPVNRYDGCHVDRTHHEYVLQGPNDVGVHSGVGGVGGRLGVRREGPCPVVLDHRKEAGHELA